MQPASNVGRLNTADWESVQDLVTRFEDACQGGEIAGLEQFLLPVGNPMRVLALYELIKSDLEIHWRRRQRITLEDYLNRFPELKARPSDWPKLLLEEYRVRQKFGDKPVLAEYQRRFPEQFRALEQMVTDNAGTATIAHSPGTANVPPVTPPAPEPPTKPQVNKPAAVEAAKPGAKGGRPPPEVGNGYKLISPLGSGTFGQVWRAEAPGGVPAAVKIIFRPIDHEEAKRELQALEKIRDLRHPFLTATQAFWTSGEKLCIAMELADGSLRDRAKECRAAGMSGIPVPELLGYFKEAAEALDYLHDQDLLHRDIKPDNLLLVKPAVKADQGQERTQRLANPGVRSHLKLGDFGLVRIFESQRMQASGAGTPAYMPPEVWNGQISRHSDQYSLAITYAELRRGKAVFAGTNMYELMVEALSKEPDLTGLDEGEQKVLRKALEKDPANRYESCLDFAYALEKAMAPPPPASVPMVAPPGQQTLPPGVEWDPALHGTILPHTVPDSVNRQGSRPSWQRDTATIQAQQTGPAPPRNFLPMVLLVLVALVPVGFLLYQILAPGPSPAVIPSVGPSAKEPSFHVQAPEKVTVRAGETTSINLHVERENFSAPLVLTFSDLPEGVTIPKAEMPGDRTTINVEAKADWEAPPCEDKQVKVSATGGKKPLEVSFKLTVTPSAVVFHRADGWVKVPGAEVKKDDLGRLFYDKIDVVRDGQSFRFLLIPLRDRKLDLKIRIPSFYIMENKVSFGQFRLFAEKHPDKVKDKRWKEKGDPPVGGKYPEDDKLPVFNVLVEDAYRFAQWLGGPGGNLPTTEQWDKASGRFEIEPGDGPFIAPWNKDDPKQIAVGRGLDGGPMECGKATHDISYFKCRDMAGNGREWTRNCDQGGRTVPQPDSNDLVLLRGHTFRGNWGPLLFSQLDQANVTGATGFYQTPENDIGFRVVIEP